MEYSKISNPKWANAQNTLIDCMVYFDHISEEVPFTANTSDVEEHGREIFARCAAGEFGEVAAYVPPPEPVAQATQTEAIQQP